MKAFKYSILFATLLLARNPAHAETPASTDKDVAVSTTTAVINTGPGRAPLGLVPLKNLESESSLISAGRVVEIAAGELNANIGALQKEEAGLKKEIAAFEAARHLELVAFEPVRKAYEVRLAAYNLIKDPLEADIAAYNRRPQAQQDQATHDRLEARINALEAERKGLDVQKRPATSCTRQPKRDCGRSPIDCRSRSAGGIPRWASRIASSSWSPTTRGRSTRSSKPATASRESSIPDTTRAASTRFWMELSSSSRHSPVGDLTPSERDDLQTMSLVHLCVSLE
jgi:hypothetical protein